MFLAPHKETGMQHWTWLHASVISTLESLRQETLAQQSILRDCLRKSKYQGGHVSGWPCSSTPEIEPLGTGVQDQHQLYREFEASLSHVEVCFRKIREH